MTEHEKYAQGATKPGGFAAQGFFGDGTPSAGGESAGAAEGLEFLSTRAPWKCSICNVNCTSQETLMGHASGAKHKRRAKAAIAARNGGNGKGGEAAPAEQQQANGEKETVVAAPEANGKSEEQGEDKKEKESKGKSDKKGKKEIKWKKLAVAELKRSGGEMKAKKLLKAVLAAAGSEGSDSDAVLEKLEKSKKFKFEGKIVSLKA